LVQVRTWIGRAGAPPAGRGGPRYHRVAGHFTPRQNDKSGVADRAW